MPGIRAIALAAAVALPISAHGTAPARADEASDLIMKGNELYQEGNYTRAREAYTEALSIRADDIRALNNRGLAFAKLGEHEAALEDLGVAVTLAPDNGAIWNNRANVNCDIKRVDASIADRMQALYRGRFTASEAQSGLRRTGFYSGPRDGIWGYDSERALLEWTQAGCPRPPASRLF